MIHAAFVVLTTLLWKKTLFSVTDMLLFFLFCVTGFLLTLNLCVLVARRRRRFSPFNERTLRPPGHALSDQFYDLCLFFSLRVVGFAFCLAVFMLFITRTPLGQNLVLVSLAGLLLSLFAYRLNNMFQRAQNVRLGYEGELYTGQELNYLMRERAFVFHDIPYHSGNIDHVVVGNNVIYAVETKAVRKPLKAGTAAAKEASMTYDADRLYFPHFKDSRALTQARGHANYLAKDIKAKTGVSFKVVPVVAIPGWFIECGKPAATDILVINPKRGKFLKNRLGEITDKAARDRVVQYFERCAPIDLSRNQITDPDGAKHFDWLLRRRRVRGVATG